MSTQASHAPAQHPEPAAARPAPSPPERSARTGSTRGICRGVSLSRKHHPSVFSPAAELRRAELFRRAAAQRAHPPASRMPGCACKKSTQLRPRPAASIRARYSLAAGRNCGCCASRRQQRLRALCRSTICSAVSRKSVPSAHSAHVGQRVRAASGRSRPRRCRPSTVIRAVPGRDHEHLGRAAASPRPSPVRGSMQRLTTDAAASSTILICSSMSCRPPDSSKILRAQRRPRAISAATRSGRSTARACPCVGKRRRDTKRPDSSAPTGGSAAATPPAVSANRPPTPARIASANRQTRTASDKSRLGSVKPQIPADAATISAAGEIEPRIDRGRPDGEPADDGHRRADGLRQMEPRLLQQLKRRPAGR